VLCQAADEFAHLNQGSFDIVVINSVIQYFPDAAYLLRVIEGAVKLLTPVGKLFIGDVRNLKLLGAFHASVELRKAAQNLPVSLLQQRVRKQIAQENELLVDPEYFSVLKRCLPRIGQVHVLPKQEAFDNELSKFRYDVILSCESARPASAIDWLPWQRESFTLALLESRLQSGPDTLGLCDIPNARTWGDALVWERMVEDSASTVATLLAQSSDVGGIEPEDLRALAHRYGYDLQISLFGTDQRGSYQAVFCRTGHSCAPDFENVFPAVSDISSFSRYTNQPLANRRIAALQVQLRAYLEPMLPEYMLPQEFFFLDVMPLTPNGKIDRKALPVLEAADLQDRFTAPRNDIETTLAEIWAATLKLDKVGIHDNFYDLGGDSLRSMDLIAKAKSRGLHITPKQIIQHPTVAELAAMVAAGDIPDDRTTVIGTVPIAPRQKWFFELEYPNPSYFNSILKAEVPVGFDVDVMANVVGHLLVHHDALRLRFRRAPGGWEQFIADVDQARGFEVLDLSTLSRAEQLRAMQERGTALHGSLDLLYGPLFKIVYVNLGNDSTGRLLLITHHLVVDGRAGEVIMEDLLSLYMQAKRGQPLQLPGKSTSFKEWAEHITATARSPRLRDQTEYWMSLGNVPFMPLPLDHHRGDNVEGSARVVESRLSPTRTKRLQQSLKRHGVKITDMLLTALLRTFAEWTGGRSLWVELTHHGRSAFSENLDLSRTVGWLTANFPAALKMDSSGDTLVSVKQQLAEIPDEGAGYGLLRYASDDAEVVAKLKSLPQPEVFFNYLGHLPPSARKGAKLQQESFGPHRHPAHARSWLVYCKAATAGEQLVLWWEYSDNRHRRETIDRLAEQFWKKLEELNS
jgi:non-ribosomal peptide synthase protein (TIGR01720 family)